MKYVRGDKLLMPPVAHDDVSYKQLDTSEATASSTPHSPHVQGRQEDLGLDGLETGIQSFHHTVGSFLSPS